MAGTPPTALFEEPACPVCGGREYRVLRPPCYPAGLTEEDVRAVYTSSSDAKLQDQLVGCRGCGLVYLSPRLKSEFILRGYGDNVDPTFIRQNPFRIRTFTKALTRLRHRFGIEPGRISGRVLDIGCAGGAFPKAAADLGFPVTGIEPSRWLCEQGRMAYGLDLRPGVLEDYSWQPGEFSLVTLWDVVEHLTDPAVTLRAIRPILADDGYLVINYPDINSLASRLLGSRWPMLLNVHLFYFTRRTITLFLEKQGFAVLEITPFFQTLALDYALGRAAAYFPPVRLLQKVALWLGDSSLPLTYNIGQNLVVARKRV